MTINFAQIDTSGKNAGVFFEAVKGPKTGAFKLKRRKIIVGTAIAASSGAKLAVTRVYDAEDGHKLWGYGTPIGAMVQESFAVNPGIELYVLASSDTAGTAATFILTITGSTASADGVVKGRIGGVWVSASVPKTSTPTQAAAALVAAIQLEVKLPTSAANAAGVVTATAKWKGETGSDIRLTDFTIADTSGASIGLSIAVVAGVAGAGDPDQTAAVGVLQNTDITFTQIATEYSNATAVGLLKDEVVRRANAMVSRRCTLFTSKYGAQAAVTTWEGSRSEALLCAIAFGTSPGLPWLHTAHVAALRASASSALVSSLGATLPSRIPRPSRAEAISSISREALAGLGISCLKLNEFDQLEVEILRMSDGSSLYTNEMLAEVEYDLKSSLYEQVIAAGLRIVSDNKDPQSFGEISPEGIKSIMATRIRGALRNYFTDPEAVIAALVVERDESNLEAVNIMFTSELVKFITRLHIKGIYT